MELFEKKIITILNDLLQNVLYFRKQQTQNSSNNLQYIIDCFLSWIPMFTTNDKFINNLTNALFHTYKFDLRKLNTIHIPI